MKENWKTNAGDLNKRTLDSQKKIDVGGPDAREAHFELNKIAGELENSDIREQATAEYKKRKGIKVENKKEKKDWGPEKEWDSNEYWRENRASEADR